MKKNLSNIILVFVFFIGLSVALYPLVSDYVNSKTQSRAIANYSKITTDMSEDDLVELRNRAIDYNETLYKNKNGGFSPHALDGYKDILDVGGTGIMGYISIDKIKVELPIYHGTNEGVLQVAVGHLEGSSLPVGGVNTHCVLSAHRGLPSAKLFTNLDQLEEGDYFRITVLNEEITYQVDQIRIVKPSEVNELGITKDEDYCTLVTCTPYAINTHRLLVRGKRCENISQNGIYVSTEAYPVDPILVVPLVAMPMLLVLLVGLLVKYRKKK